jgi:hypothetical protein
MDPKISKETVNLFFDKLSKLLNNVFPGMVVLEIFFHKGFFSVTPNTISEFILFLVWSIILSAPYNFLPPFSIANFYDDFLRFASKSLSVKKEIIQSSFTDDERDNFKEETSFGFIIIQLFVTYLTAKLVSSQFTLHTFWGLSSNILSLFISLAVTLFLRYPIGYIYSKLLQRAGVKFISNSRK